MTRTLARRLATTGGALGIAVLACAGTASAATVPAPAAPVQASAALHFGDVPVVTCPPHHYGLVGDVLVDLGHILAAIL
jgi:hypothetical protein